MFDLGVLDFVLNNRAKGKKLRNECQHQKIAMEITTELTTESQFYVLNPVCTEYLMPLKMDHFKNDTEVFCLFSLIYQR